MPAFAPGSSRLAADAPRCCFHFIYSPSILSSLVLVGAYQLLELVSAATSERVKIKTFKARLSIGSAEDVVESRSIAAINATVKLLSWKYRLTTAAFTILQHTFRASFKTEAFTLIVMTLFKSFEKLKLSCGNFNRTI